MFAIYNIYLYQKLSYHRNLVSCLAADQICSQEAAEAKTVENTSRYINSVTLEYKQLLLPELLSIFV